MAEFSYTVPADLTVKRRFTNEIMSKDSYAVLLAGDQLAVLAWPEARALWLQLQGVKMLRYIPPRGPDKLPLPGDYGTVRRRLGDGHFSGPRALLLSIAFQAIIDYLSGPDDVSEDARWWLAGEGGAIDAIAGVFNLPPGTIPIIDALEVK